MSSYSWLDLFRMRHGFAASPEIETLILAARDQGRIEGAEKLMRELRALSAEELDARLSRAARVGE